MELNNFNPNGVGVDNGHFIGLPFNELDAQVVVISVPWDVTVSYSAGTSKGPENVLMASPQLDLMQHGLPDAWKMGIYVRPSDEKILQQNNTLRKKSSRYIAFLETGGEISSSPEMQNILEEVNTACENLHEHVYHESKKLLEKGKIPAVLGGEHSCPLGLLRALKEHVGDFGVLQIDAHMDLRNAYEGFTYSHASIFNNVLTKGYASALTQVGIRDYCEEEVAVAEKYKVSVFYDEDIKENLFKGVTWHQQVEKMVSSLPQQVYVSFDIDGLTPSLCPETGTPVPGGLEFAEAIYLIKQVVKSGRNIIGFDLCEVGGTQVWDGNVGARILYNLCNWTGKSQGLL